jgi:hypothetical protein
MNTSIAGLSKRYLADDGYFWHIDKRETLRTVVREHRYR